MACAVVITLETQKCRKGHLAPLNLTFLINCDRHKRFSQNERRRAELQPQIFLNFCLGHSYDLSKFSDEFTTFSTLKDHNEVPGQKLKNPRHAL